MSQCVRKVFYNDRVQPRPHCWTALKWCVANCAIAGAKRAKRLNQNDNPARNGCEQNMCDVYSHLIYTKFALPHPFSCTANIKASRILFICLRHSTYNHRIYFGSCMRFKRGKLFKEVPQLNLIPWSDNISRLFIIRSVYIFLARMPEVYFYFVWHRLRPIRECAICGAIVGVRENALEGYLQNYMI